MWLKLYLTHWVGKLSETIIMVQVVSNSLGWEAK